LEINVTGAASEEKALVIARSIADSYLVKTAFNGEDANWGRIISAAGYSGVEVDLEKAELMFNDLVILKPGYKSVFSEEEAKIVLSNRNIKVNLNLNEGSCAEKVYTSDLSKEYVAINANYRS
jgi:glutamate N-acetyltransferase / amino-acid N-acetyltransferase